jgi:Zn-finger protein
MSDEQIVICGDCETGFYHNYNGVWLCQFCGQPKSKEPVEVPLKPRPVAATTTRKGRKTDE